MQIVSPFLGLLISLNLFSNPCVDTVPLETMMKDYIERQSVVVEESVENTDSSQEVVIPEKELTREELYALKLDIPAPFTEADLRMLTTMVFKENGLVTNDVLVVDAEHPKGVYMPADVMHEWTAQVCLNHLKDSRFPNTIYEDLAYPRYTSEYRSASLAAKCKSQYPEQWKRVEQSCLLAMNGYVDLPADVIYESNYPQLGRRYAAVFVDTGWFSSWSYFAHG